MMAQTTQVRARKNTTKKRAKPIQKPLFNESFLRKALRQKLRLYHPGYRIWTDSRSLRSGDIFVAIRGEKFDGHDFIKAAIASGASAAIVSKIPTDLKHFKDKKFSLIQVKDTTEALRKLASAHRARLKIDLIAVAGSNGKTTTKEWVAFLLQEIFGDATVFKTEKSNNSILGIALSLLQIRDETKAVIEIGIDEPGWMDQHLKIVRPTHGIITTIAEEHLNRLKNIETVAREELKLFYFLKKHNGRFAANIDSEWIAKLKLSAADLSYSLASATKPPSSKSHSDIEGVYSAPQTLHAFGVEFCNPLPGSHNAQNLLAALATLRLMKCDLRRADLVALSESIRKFVGEPHRSRLIKTNRGIHIFDDCYNANPDSMTKALDTFVEMSSGCRQIVVLGEMLDLGNSSSEAHLHLLNRVAVLGFENVYLYGKEFKLALESLKRPPSEIRHFSEMSELIGALNKILDTGDFLFVKGSRGNRLERVIDAVH